METMKEFEEKRKSLWNEIRQLQETQYDKIDKIKEQICELNLLEIELMEGKTKSAGWCNKCKSHCWGDCTA